MKKKYIKPEVRVRAIVEDAALMVISGGESGTLSVDDATTIDGTNVKFGSKVNKTILWDDEEE